MSTTSEIIHQAVTTNTRVWIRYRNKKGEVREHTITPKRMENESILIGTYADSDKELRFSVNGVLEIELVNDNDNDGAEAIPGTVIDHPKKPPISSTAMPSAPPLGPPFAHVHDGDHWSRLLRYYHQCLVTENRQQYIVERQKLRTVNLTPTDIQRFRRIQKLKYS